MTNLTDITIILDNSPRAEVGEKDITKTDCSKPLEPNVDESKTGKEASDASLDILTATTTTEKLNLSAKDIERDSTRPNSAKPIENNLKEIELNIEADVKKCEDEDSTSTLTVQHKDSSISRDKSETTQDTAISRPNSSNLKEKESKENRKEFSVEKPRDENDNKGNGEGDACTGGVNGENMKKIFDILDESKSGHISPVSFGHLIRSLGDLLTTKSDSYGIIFRILSN